MRQKKVKKKKKKRLIEVKWFMKDLIKPMILENLKQYMFLVMKLEIILLIRVWQMMNKNSCQSILENLKARQDHKILSQKKVKEAILYSATALLQGGEMVFKAFESGMFLKTEELKKGKGLKILTPKQILQRLPIALAQIKAGNSSESLLNEIRRIVYSLYQSKEITKKVYNNIIKSIKV